MSTKNEKSIIITCPTCNKLQTIKVPYSIFEEKKTGTIKIQIHQGICCEHEFIAFFDPKGNSRGYEKFDAAIDLSFYKHSKIEIFLRDILKKFGDHTLNLMLHAIMINSNVIVLHDKYVPIDNVSTKRLNLFLNKCLPEEYQKPLLFMSMLDRNYYKTQIDTALVINTTGIVEVQPWTDIPLIYEKKIIKTALTILDEQLQPIIIQEEFRMLFEKCKYFNDVITEWHSIYLEDLVKLLKVKIKSLSEYDFELFKQIVQSRFKGNVSKIKMPKVKKKHSPSPDVYF